jgi:hypothetical protein
MFFWNTEYALSPSLAGNYHGLRHSSANDALLYLGKIGGRVFGGVVVGVFVSDAELGPGFRGRRGKGVPRQRRSDCFCNLQCPIRGLVSIAILFSVI